MVLNTIKPS